MDTEPQAKIRDLHNITFNRSRNSWKIRVTIDRGKKVTGKRICVDVPAATEAEAIGARDAVLAALAAVGLKAVKPKPRRVGQSAKVTGCESFGTMAA